MKHILSKQLGCMFFMVHRRTQICTCFLENTTRLNLKSLAGIMRIVRSHSNFPRTFITTLVSAQSYCEQSTSALLLTRTRISINALARVVINALVCCLFVTHKYTFTMVLSGRFSKCLKWRFWVCFLFFGVVVGEERHKMVVSQTLLTLFSELKRCSWLSFCNIDIYLKS